MLTRKRRYYNDYNLEYNGAKTERALELVRIVQEAGAPIDGVGFQGHLIVGSTPSRDSLATVLRRFTALGVEVAYTEIDIRHSNMPPSSSDLVTQGNDFANVVGSCLDVEGCIGVTVWSFTDKYSWGMCNITLPRIYPSYPPPPPSLAHQLTRAPHHRSPRHVPRRGRRAHLRPQLQQEAGMDLHLVGPGRRRHRQPGPQHHPGPDAHHHHDAGPDHHLVGRRPRADPLGPVRRQRLDRPHALPEPLDLPGHQRVVPPVRLRRRGRRGRTPDVAAALKALPGREVGRIVKGVEGGWLVLERLLLGFSCSLECA